MELYETRGKFKREDFAPLSFWAWNDKMEDDEIQRQIADFHNQGFGGFFMHSRGGLRTPYLSEDWFHACRTAVKAAEKYGMKAWIYDEDGWPSGFAGGRVNGLGEEYMAKYFFFRTEKPANPHRVIASYRRTESGYSLCAFDEAKLWAVYEVEPDYADLLSEEVTRTFIGITHERYKKELGEYFGSVIPGFFTDEPQFFRTGYPFSRELSEYFVKRNGYSMEPELYRLMPSWAREDSWKFRRDFWDTVQEMMEFHFTRQISGWCRENSLIFTGHYPGEDSLIQQMVSTAGVMPKYRHMQMPGIDHLGRRITSLLLTKQVTSIAKQFGQKQVLSETFGCAGWNIPFEDMCYIWGWQAAAGINVPVLHLGAYTMAGTRKRDYPAFYSYQEPWWGEFHHISEWLSGIGYQMSMGRWLEEILVISPMQSIFYTHGSDTEFTDLEREISASYRQLCDCLMEVQVGFDLCDETVMKDEAKIQDGFVTVGKCRYRMIIIPKCMILTEPVWDMLEEFHSKKGMIVFADQIPKSGNERSWTKECPVICNVKRFWLKFFQSIHFERTVGIYDRSGFHLAEGLNVAVKEDGEIIRTYIWNRQADSERELLLRVTGSRTAFIVNPETLERKRLKGTWVDREGCTVLPLSVSKKESVLLELEPGGVYQEQPVETEQTRRIPGQFTRTEDNLLTIDYASFSLDGGAYSEPMPIVKLQPAIYQELTRRRAEVLSVKYEFDNRMTLEKNLTAVVENRECIDIFCNGTSIYSQKQGWYMDRECSVYSLDKTLRSGLNTIEVLYDIKDGDIKDAEGLFETQVNRFFYPIEPEAIYMKGDFSVSTENQVNRQLTHIRVSADGGIPKFYLTDTLKSGSGVMNQGLWFYRGDLQMTLKLSKRKGQRIFIKFIRPASAFVEVRCNGASAVSYMSPYQIELTEYLCEGEQELTLILHGTNRNLLGPHHHCKGENLFVGCNTFKGQKGYEDTMFNFEVSGGETWTNDYSFVPFDCEAIEILTREEMES